MDKAQFFKQAFNKSLIPFHLIYELCVCVCVIHLLQCDTLILNAGGDAAGQENKWMSQGRRKRRVKKESDPSRDSVV